MEIYINWILCWFIVIYLIFFSCMVWLICTPVYLFNFLIFCVWFELFCFGFESAGCYATLIDLVCCVVCLKRANSLFNYSIVLIKFIIYCVSALLMLIQLKYHQLITIIVQERDQLTWSSQNTNTLLLSQSTSCYNGEQVYNGWANESVCELN